MIRKFVHREDTIKVAETLQNRPTPQDGHLLPTVKTSKNAPQGPVHCIVFLHTCE